MPVVPNQPGPTFTVKGTAMKKTFKQILTIAVIALAGTAGAIVVGLLRYGTEVFVPASPGFSFVSFGFSGALIFAFYHVRGLSEAITASVVVSAVQFIAGSAYIAMLRAVLFSFGLNIPVIALAFVFERKLAAHRRIKFAVVSLTYGAMFVLLTLLADVISGQGGLPAPLFRENFVDGLLLGLGLGLGVEAGEAFMVSFEHPAVQKPQG
jgi:thiamine transporter ThiT